MSNSHGEASNFRGAMSNFHGEASNFRGAMSNFRGEATGDRGEATNFCGEATGFRQWPLHKWIYYINEVKTHILVTHRRSQDSANVYVYFFRFFLLISRKTAYLCIAKSE